MDTLRTLYDPIYATGKSVEHRMASGANLYEALVMTLDPVYSVLEGYSNEVTDYNNGCSAAVIFADGLQGVLGLVGTFAFAGGAAAGIGGAIESMIGRTSAVKASTAGGYYPPNDGVIGAAKRITLQPGTIIDRYGFNQGKFAAPAGTPSEMRSLSPNTNLAELHTFEVLKPIPGVSKGNTAPWFGEVGGGTQFKFQNSMQELIEGGYIRER